MNPKTLLLCTLISAQYSAQNSKTEYSADYDTCFCKKNETVNRSPVYFPQLVDLKSYNMFSKLIPWKLAGGEEAYSKLFYKNYQFSINTSGSAIWEYYILVTPIKPVLSFTHPENSIGINLTPCQSQFRDFNITGTTEYPIMRYMRYDFEKDFDHYSQSYVDILCRMIDSEREILPQALAYKNKNEIESIIAQINKKYKADVVYDDDGEYLDYIPIVLSEKKIPFSQFINDIFIKTDDEIRPINETEKTRINNIFNTFSAGNAMDTVLKLITPVIRFSSDAEYISLIIDEKMLHQTNSQKNTATEILVGISSLTFETKTGFSLQIDKICLPQSEIADTGILISGTSEHAEFVNSSTLTISDGVKISIPSKGINTEIKNLKLNNKIISGDIKTDHEISEYLRQKGFKISLENKNIHFEKTNP
ncbi:MAG: hypothetical protein LBE36_00860 [Flavobacteriaceae bacterium]|jgi:hypothetical protein|nr:hypothetical protein [Flavobacteriaceae bacterium]